MKSDAVYKRAFNQVAGMLTSEAVSSPLPSENALCGVTGVSRTTIRKVLAELERRSVLVNRGGARLAGRRVTEEDLYPDAETTSRNQRVEQQFMEWMLRGDTRPGALINELETARQFGVATNGIREFLIRFSRFGLIEKRPNSGWLFKGFNEAFALELFEIRMMFELRSARLFVAHPRESPIWAELARLKAEHLQLLEGLDTRFHDFSSLDNRFHRLINQISPNRFIDEFYDVITFIFHYHYQWNKKDEKQRNRVAIIEHLAYIDGLFSGDVAKVERSCREHLASARQTLIQSLVGS